MTNRIQPSSKKRETSQSEDKPTLETIDPSLFFAQGRKKQRELMSFSTVYNNAMSQTTMDLDEKGLVFYDNLACEVMAT